MQVAKNMSLLNPLAYSTGVVKDWNITESRIKHEPPDPPCLQQRSGKWLKHYWKCQKTWASSTPTPFIKQKCDKWLKQYWEWHKTWDSWTPCLEQRSGKWLKHYWKCQQSWASCTHPPAYSKSVVNDWNNIESDIKHEPPETPCI
jgi:hypothetical protein